MCATSASAVVSVLHAGMFRTFGSST